MIRRLRRATAFASCMACLMTAWSLRPAVAAETSSDAPASASASAPEAAEAAVAAKSTAAAVVPMATTVGGDHSAVSTQAISLPSGAGTVGGMGESFSAQLSTVVATGRIDVALPAARGGARPSLALVYSSSNGHGGAGVGWELGVPSI